VFANNVQMMLTAVYNTNTAHPLSSLALTVQVLIIVLERLLIVHLLVLASPVIVTSIAQVQSLDAFQISVEPVLRILNAFQELRFFIVHQEGHVFNVSLTPNAQLLLFQYVQVSPVRSVKMTVNV